MSDAYYDPPDNPMDRIFELYEESDRFDIDAMEWFAVAPEVPDHIVTAIRQWYRDTDRCAMVVEDIADGADTL